MLTIKDISSSKELDSKAMTEVRGGFGDATQVIGNSQVLGQSANGFLVAVNEGYQNQNTVAVNEAYAQLNKLGLFGSVVL